MRVLERVCAILFSAGVFCVSARGGVQTVISDVNDRGVRGFSTNLNVGASNCRIGSETAGQITVFVLPFLLPELPAGESVTNAVLNLYSEANANPNGQARVDIRGVRTADTAVVQSSDSTNGTLLVDGAYVLDSSLPVNQMLSFSSDALAAWVRDAYSGGGTGKYVFLTAAPDVANTAGSRYVTVSSANTNAVAQQPALVLQTGSSSSTQAVVATTLISQFGITWQCKGTVQTGQYANGDFWVVGPVEIVSVSNSLHASGFFPTSGMDGCMINPGTDTKQGYDNRLTSYLAALNQSYPNGSPISSANPLVLPVNSSLISSVSWIVGEPGCPALNGGTGEPRPVLRSAAILTCVSNAPPAGAFRPPYCGADKTARFNKSQLDYSKLGRLAPVAYTPAVTNVEAKFAGPWIDHVHEYLGAMLHPTMHMQQYGRDLSVDIGEGALMLQLDFAQLPGSPPKETLLIRFTQLGIDLAGIADNNGGWPSNGGHQMGRKWPILCAGVVLNDAHMKAVGSWPTDFQEDLDTFYVAQASIDATHSASWNPDTRGDAEWPYEAVNLGLPEWGIRHTVNPYTDNLHWSATYRSINNQAYPGWVLAALIMGQRTAWSHEALFDYIDRSTSIIDPYSSVELVGDFKNATYVYGTQFIRAMWQTYRANYPPQWVPEDPADAYGQGAQVSPSRGFLFYIK